MFATDFRKVINFCGESYVLYHSFIIDHPINHRNILQLKLYIVYLVLRLHIFSMYTLFIIITGK